MCVERVRVGDGERCIFVCLCTRSTSINLAQSTAGFPATTVNFDQTMNLHSWFTIENLLRIGRISGEIICNSVSRSTVMGLSAGPAAAAGIAAAGHHHTGGKKGPGDLACYNGQSSIKL